MWKFGGFCLKSFELQSLRMRGAAMFVLPHNRSPKTMAAWLLIENLNEADNIHLNDALQEYMTTDQDSYFDFEVIQVRTIDIRSI